MKLLNCIAVVNCLCFVLLRLPAHAIPSHWQHHKFKFVTFDAPANTKLVAMPDLALPTKVEGKLLVDFILLIRIGDWKVNTHIACTLAGSAALQNISPDKMQRRIRAALLSNGPILSSRRFVLQNSKLPAELIKQKSNKKYVWTILASNQKIGLTIAWGRPIHEDQMVAEMIRLANSLRLMEEHRTSHRLRK